MAEKIPIVETLRERVEEIRKRFWERIEAIRGGGIVEGKIAGGEILPELRKRIIERRKALEKTIPALEKLPVLLGGERELPTEKKEARRPTRPALLRPSRPAAPTPRRYLERIKRV